MACKFNARALDGITSIKAENGGDKPVKKEYNPANLIRVLKAS